MFLIESFDDHLAYIVDPGHVIIEDGKQHTDVIKNDVVKFIMKKKQHEGKVIEYSTNSKYLQNQRVRFNKLEQKISTDKRSADLTVKSNKRKPIPKKSWSPELSPPSKKSKKTGKINRLKSKGNKSAQYENSDTTDTSVEISDDSVNELKEPSPTKEELKKQIERLMAERGKSLLKDIDINIELPKKQSIKATTSNKAINEKKPEKRLSTVEGFEKNDECESPENKLPVIDANELDMDQLFPHDYDDGNMIHIGKNIYCRNKIYLSALGASQKATHLARRLLEGVFKHEALMGCTVTGQAPRGSDKKYDVQPLNQRAKDAIIDFAISFAAKKQWSVQTKSRIKKEMGQKLTEYRRDYTKKI